MPRNSNFITRYSLNPEHQLRFDEPEGHWLQLQRRFNRWGGGHTWERLRQLGQIARTNQYFGSYFALQHADNVRPQVVSRHSRQDYRK